MGKCAEGLGLRRTSPGDTATSAQSGSARGSALPPAPAGSPRSEAGAEPAGGAPAELGTATRCQQAELADCRIAARKQR